MRPALPSLALPVHESNPLAAQACQELVASLRRDIAPWRVEVHALAAEMCQHALVEVTLPLVPIDLQRRQRAIPNGFARIDDEGPGVDLYVRTDPATRRAHARRDVEAEELRRGLLVRDAALSASERRSHDDVFAAVVVARHDVHHERAAAHSKRRLHRFRDP